MAHDVFLVAAADDLDLAKIVARRLRALKFKVRFDAKMTDDVFDDKEARDVSRARAMVILWSKNAVTSDFVRAAASMGYSRRDRPLIQARLDSVVPYEPFKAEKRFNLTGMTSRSMPADWPGLVDALGNGLGRPDLPEWMGFANQDEDGHSQWLANHPEDPLAVHAEKQAQAELAPPQRAKNRPPASADLASSAAALAESSIKVRPIEGGKVEVPSEPQPIISETAQERGLWVIAPVIAIIASMLGLAALNSQPRSVQQPILAQGQDIPPGLCPVGTIHRSLFERPPLEGGGVDTNR